MSIVHVVIDASQPTNKVTDQHFFHVAPCFFSEKQEEDVLETLIHQVSKTPDDLICHSRRIYYCFLHHHNDHLFAALTDLLLFLNGNGVAFARRMTEGARKALSRQQLDLLREALKFNDFSALQTVRFSLFSSGRITALPLVEKRREPSRQKNADVLTLAQDFIEYSQLEQAMEVLEQALFKSDREDIQSLLLELYRSTQNGSRFAKIYRQAQARQKSLIPDWLTVQQFFSDKLS